MVSSFSNLVYNRSKGVHRKFRHGNKKCETCRIECKYCDCFLKYINFKDNLIEYKCLYCNKNCNHKFDKKIKGTIFYTYTFSNHDNNKFILLLRKGVYPYEYMNDWEKFNETFLQSLEYGRSY